MKDVFAVILAGGSGTRFWPKSRHHLPKQLCAIGSTKKTMIETTLERLEGFVPAERRLIVTHRDQADATRRIVGRRCPRIIAEPEARNTAAALALAALEIRALAEPGIQPIMISLHADHIVTDLGIFRQAILDAVDLARQGRLTLLGIIPRHPETGFGYIEQGSSLSTTRGREGFNVKSFREKPSRDVAAEFVRSGRFYWNAGLFIWRIDTFLAELALHLPVTTSRLELLIDKEKKVPSSIETEVLAEAYAKLPKISIDHALLEKSRNVAVIPVDFGWQDVGSWSALAECFPSDEQGNLIFGDSLLIDTNRTTIDTDGPLVACLGVSDLVVVAAQGAVLVCAKERAQDVRQIVEELTKRGRKDLV